jgi:glycosyltransferase involved in cell wall biosynthesis
MEISAVSVLMPVFNGAKYLHQSIESILNQTYENYEFIIINDGSCDGSLDIIRDYARHDRRIKVIDQQNIGYVDALKNGIGVARGEWIFRMDQDDVSYPERLEIQLEAIKRDPSIVLVGGWCRQISENDKAIKINKYAATAKKLIKQALKGGMFIPHSSACFSRAAYMRVGGYRARLYLAEDLDLWLRLSDVGTVYCCQDVLVDIKIHNQSASRMNRRRQSVSAMIAMMSYFLRKDGLQDVVNAGDNDWLIFKEWAENEMERKGVFQRNEVWCNLWCYWHSRSKGSKYKFIISLFKDLRSVMELISFGRYPAKKFALSTTVRL